MGNHQPTVNDLVCVCVNPNKKLNVTNPSVCEFNLNYFHIYVHSHYQKE
jgi:hypothetical protein